MLDRALKILWLANGALVFALLLYMGYHFFSQELNPTRFDVEKKSIPSEDESDGIKEGAVRPSLEYRKIQSVPGTTIRILPVATHPPDTFLSEPTESFFSELKEYAGDRFPRNDDVNSITSNNVNLIFLDIDYRVIRTLLDRKAFIHSVASPVAETVINTLNPRIRNIVYLISFEDSNHDGKLDELDNSDLYVSNVDGSDLVQATKDVFVQNYKFINNNSEILISFRNRGTAEAQPPRFAKYQIARETLVEMSDLNEELLKVNNLMVDSTESKK